MSAFFHLYWTCEPGSRGSASLPPAMADHVPYRVRARIRAGAILKHSPYHLTASLTQTPAQGSFRYPLIFASFCSINLPIFCSSNLLYERFRVFTALSRSVRRWPDRSPPPKPVNSQTKSLPSHGSTYSNVSPSKLQIPSHLCLLCFLLFNKSPIFYSSNLLYEWFRAFTALSHSAQRWPDRSPPPKPATPAAPDLPALRTALPHPGSLLGQRSPA